MEQPPTDDEDPCRPGAVLRSPAFYGPVEFAGDAVAGDKIIQLPVHRPPPPAQLPLDLPDFIGRQDTLRRLDALRDSGDRPGMSIAAVHGMPGVGKTTLAVHWAHRVAGRFPDGQLFLDLRGHPARTSMPVEEALAQLLRALGVPTPLIPPGQAERAALYRSLLAGRRTLLVLVNAACTAQVEPLLPGSSTCVTVITSRDQLTGLVARDSAKSVWLDVMSPADSLAVLRAMLGQDRVAAEPAAANELARWCGHLPLALRLAAASLAVRPSMSIGDAVRELVRGDRLALLSLGEEELPGAAVAAAFDLSYEDLRPDQRRAFRYLGLLDRHDFGRDTAAALLGVPRERAVQLLDELERANLVEATVPGRYRLCDLLHDYAEHRLWAEDTEHERQEAVRRLISWLRAGAEQTLAAIAHAYDLLGDGDQLTRYRTLARAAACEELSPGVRPGAFTL